MKTLQEIKDEVEKEEGFINWKEVCFRIHKQACEAQRSQDGNIYWENRDKQDVFISNKIQYTPIIELK